MSNSIRFDDSTVFARDYLLENEGQAQLILGKYKALGVHPICECTANKPAMYIAKRSVYYLAKMPGTGSSHAPSCPSFEIITNDSGKAGYESNVIKSNSNGTLSLKLYAPLSHKVVQREDGGSTGESNAIPSEKPKSDKEEAMTLNSLLAVLWEEAELNRWAPYFDGKRSWGVVRRRLLVAADNMIAKRTYLKDILHIPEPFNPNSIDEIDARRKEQFDNIMKRSGKNTRYMLVVARIRKINIQDNIVSIRLSQQGENIVYWGGKSIAKKVDRANLNELLDTDTKTADEYLMTVMVVTRDGNKALSILDIGFLRVDKNYIPHYSQDDIELKEALIEQGRFFIKTLRYDTSSDITPPDYMLVDTGDSPTPLTISPAYASEELMMALFKAKKSWSENYSAYWEWDIAMKGRDIPALPRAVDVASSGDHNK